MYCIDGSPHFRTGQPHPTNIPLAVDSDYRLGWGVDHIWGSGCTLIIRVYIKYVSSATVNNQWTIWDSSGLDVVQYMLCSTTQQSSEICGLLARIQRCITINYKYTQ